MGIAVGATWLVPQSLLKPTRTYTTYDTNEYMMDEYVNRTRLHPRVCTYPSCLNVGGQMGSFERSVVDNFAFPKAGESFMTPAIGSLGNSTRFPSSSGGQELTGETERCC